jgi:hypothetical protein
MLRALHDLGQRVRHNSYIGRAEMEARPAPKIEASQSMRRPVAHFRKRLVKNPAPAKTVAVSKRSVGVRRILYVLVTVSACAAAALAFAGDNATNGAIDQAFGDHAQYEAVILSFQKAVAAHDSAAVAEPVSYPISVSVNGRKTTIRSAKAFIAHYDAIMTPDIVSTVTRQKYEDLFVNSHGVMFGKGEVWVNGVCKDNSCKALDVKIITIQHGPR